jgi:hypothetical protein
MIAELRIFENLNVIELEAAVTKFLRIKVKSIEKIYFKQETSRYTEPINDKQTENYPIEIRHTCYLVYVPIEEEMEELQ